MRGLIEEYIVAAAPQKTTTMLAEATRDPQAAEPRAAEPRPAEARTADSAAFRSRTTEARPMKPAPQATYSVASYGKPAIWPAPTAVPTPAPSPSVAPAIADAAPTAAVPAAKPVSSDPIRPIQVKTVKVKLPQVAALTPPPVTTAPEPVAAAEAPQDRSPPPAPATLPQAAAAPQSAPAAKPAAASQKAGMLGTLPFRDVTPAAAEQKREPVREAARETAPPAPPPAPQSVPRQAAPSPTAHSGWVIQVGAFDAERDARQKLSAAQAKAAELLSRASPFTEAVVKGDKTLYRARFAGLQKDEAEAACRQLKRNDIDCMTIKN